MLLFLLFSRNLILEILQLIDQVELATILAGDQLLVEVVSTLLKQIIKEDSGVALVSRVVPESHGTTLGSFAVSVSGGAVEAKRVGYMTDLSPQVMTVYPSSVVTLNNDDGKAAAENVVLSHLLYHGNGELSQLRMVRAYHALSFFKNWVGLEKELTLFRNVVKADLLLDNRSINP